MMDTRTSQHSIAGIKRFDEDLAVLEAVQSTRPDGEDYHARLATSYQNLVNQSNKQFLSLSSTIKIDPQPLKFSTSEYVNDRTLNLLMGSEGFMNIFVDMEKRAGRPLPLRVLYSIISIQFCPTNHDRVAILVQPLVDLQSDNIPESSSLFHDEDIPSISLNRSAATNLFLSNDEGGEFDTLIFVISLQTASVIFSCSYPTQITAICWSAFGDSHIFCGCSNGLLFDVDILTKDIITTTASSGMGNRIIGVYSSAKFGTIEIHTVDEEGNFLHYTSDLQVKRRDYMDPPLDSIQIINPALTSIPHVSSTTFISLGGESIVVGYHNGVVIVKEGTLKSLLRTDTQFPVIRAAVHPLSLNSATAILIAFGCFDGTLKVFLRPSETRNRSLNASDEIETHTTLTDPITALSFHPLFSTILAVGTETTFLLIHLIDGVLVQVHTTKPIMSMEWSPDGERLFLGRTDGTSFVFATHFTQSSFTPHFPSFVSSF